MISAKVAGREHESLAGLPVPVVMLSISPQCLTVASESCAAKDGVQHQHSQACSQQYMAIEDPHGARLL